MDTKDIESMRLTASAELKEAFDELASAGEDSPKVFQRILKLLYHLPDSELLVWQERLDGKRGVRTVYDEFAAGVVWELVHDRGITPENSGLASQTDRDVPEMAVRVPVNWVVVGGTKIDFTITENVKLDVAGASPIRFQNAYTVKYRIPRSREVLDIKLCEFKLHARLGEGYALFGFTFAPSLQQQESYRFAGRSKKREAMLKPISTTTIEADVATWEGILSEVAECVATEMNSRLLLPKVFVTKVLMEGLNLKVNGELPVSLEGAKNRMTATGTKKTRVKNRVTVAEPKEARAENLPPVASWETAEGSTVPKTAREEEIARRNALFSAGK